MRHIKRLMLAGTGAAMAVALVSVLLVISSALVWIGTGADPSDAFREPELDNTSLDAERTWNDTTASRDLSPLEAEQLADAWADGFALLERRANGEAVDVARRFHPSISESFQSISPTLDPFVVLEHAITLELVSENRQIAALSVEVTIQRTAGSAAITMVETYESVMTNGLSGWTIVTFNRVGAETRS